MDKCPKFETGIKCFDCPKREVCLKPSKPKPRVYPSPSTSKFEEFIPLATEKLEKHIYRMLLLMADDFLLTKPEKHELIYYASKFPPYSKFGGRGKSKERVYACLCLHLLERDNRPIYLRSKEYYDERYQLNRSDISSIKAFVSSELDKLQRVFQPQQPL